MSFLRALSMLILIAFLVTTGIAFAALTGDATTGSYYMGNNKFYFAYAWVDNDDDNHSGWHHVWAHADSGGPDIKLGEYEGDFDAYAFSLHITDLDDPNPPSPFIARKSIT